MGLPGGLDAARIAGVGEFGFGNMGLPGNFATGGTDFGPNSIGLTTGLAIAAGTGCTGWISLRRGELGAGRTGGARSFGASK